MTTNTIKRGDSSFIMRTQMATNWPKDVTVTVDIYDKLGTQLVTDGAVTRAFYPAGETIASAVDAGSDKVTLDTGGATAVLDGDHIAIGSDKQGWSPFVVDSYNSSTKVVVLNEYTPKDLEASSEVVGLDMEYTIDADTLIGSTIYQVTAYWKPSGDAQPFSQLWDVSDTSTVTPGLEIAFSIAYNNLYSLIPEGQFSAYETRAKVWLKQYFEAQGRDYDLVVDSQVTDEPIMSKIALLVMVGKGTTFNDEYERVANDLENQLTLIDALDLWVDIDNDATEDDGETEAAIPLGLSRGL